MKDFGIFGSTTPERIAPISTFESRPCIIFGHLLCIHSHTFLTIWNFDRLLVGLPEIGKQSISILVNIQYRFWENIDKYEKKKNNGCKYLRHSFNISKFNVMHIEIIDISILYKCKYRPFTTLYLLMNDDLL